MSDWLYTLPGEKDKQNKIIWNAEPNRLLILNQDPVQWEEATKALLDTKGMAASYRPRIEHALRTLPPQKLLPFLVDITIEAFLLQDAGAKRLLGTFAEILHAKGLVLLPMARRSQIDWLSTRYTHTKTPSALEQAVQSRIPETVPDKYKASTVRLLFGFAHIPSSQSLKNDDIAFFYETNFYKSLNAGYKSAFSHALQALDDIACAENPKRERLILSHRVRNQLPTLSDTSAWWFTHPKHGAPHLDQWQSAYALWLTNIKSKTIRRHAYASRRLSNYLAQRKNCPKNPAAIARADVVLTQASTETPFASWLEQENVSETVIAETLSSLKTFFEWWEDALRPANLTSWKNPVNDRDRRTYGASHVRNAKSNKSVLPKRIIDMAKDIIRENDFSFPKTLPQCYASSSTNLDEDKIFCPILPVCILLLLTLPVRGLQARLLDSGEADEFIFSQDGTKQKNLHPLSVRKRQLGVLQEMDTGPFQEHSFIGFRISTNKTAVLKDGQVETPYDIPWHEANLIEDLIAVRDWQIKHNPINKLITRKDILERSARVDGNVSNLPQYAFLFRDPNSPDRLQPLSWAKISRFWTEVLQEAERRLEKEGTSVSLVEQHETNTPSQPYRYTPKYPLHSLRVSGITHFVEAGVPLHIISEFVAGHSQLLMTLYYTKIDDTKVRNVLDDAVRRMDAIDDEDVLTAIQDMQNEDWDTAMVAGPDARQAAQANDTGMWHIDIDGICPVGRTRCHEGGELLRDNGRKETYAPISFNSFNCALCRFRLTGPAFLQGQVTVFNATLHAIKEKSDQRSKIEQELSQVRESGTERKIRTLKDRLDRVDEEIATLVVVLGRRLTHIQMSHALLKRNGEHSFLTGLDNDDLNLVLKEASEWEALDFAAQTSSFFPELGTTSARFRKGMLLDRVAQANGLEPLFLSLSPEVAAEAANRLTSLLDDMIGPQKVRDLMEYKTTLEELGLAGGFAQLVDKSIAIAQGNPLLLVNKP